MKHALKPDQYGILVANMQNTIISTITPLTSNAQRARIATYLVITSSQYKIIH